MESWDSMRDFPLTNFSKRMARFLFCLFLYISLGEGQPQFYEDTLELTHGRIVYSSLVFRHGERAPLKLALEDEDPRVYSAFPEGLTQLTKLGKQQTYDLGKWFAARYADLIKNGYRHDLITVNGTDTDRALMSGETFLAGMFPPSENETWADDGLQWQPIPVFQKCNRMVGAHDYCERFQLEADILSQTSEYQKLNATYTDVFEYIASHSGYGPMSVTDVINNIHMCWNCYNELQIQESYNLTLPSWSKKVYPKPLHYLANLHFASLARTPEMKRLRGGELVTQIRREMLQKRDGLRTESFHVYAAHESIVAILLETFDVYNFIIPPSAATVVIELRVKEEEYFVTILYKNSTNHPPYFMQLPGCGEICSLNKFAEITADFIIENWDAECQLGFLERLYYYNRASLVIACLVFILVLGTASVMSIKVIKKRRKTFSEMIDLVLTTITVRVVLTML